MHVAMHASYTCMHACMRAFVHSAISACMHAVICACMGLCMHAALCAWVCMRGAGRKCVHVCMHACVAAAGADTAMLPLLTSFEGLIEERTSLMRNEGGPLSEGGPSGVRRDTETPTGCTDGCMRHSGVPLHASGAPSPTKTSSSNSSNSSSKSSNSPVNSSPTEKYYYNKNSKHHHENIHNTSTLDIDPALVEEHLKIFSLQGLRTMG